MENLNELSEQGPEDEMSDTEHILQVFGSRGFVADTVRVSASEFGSRAARDGLYFIVVDWVRFPGLRPVRFNGV